MKIVKALRLYVDGDYLDIADATVPDDEYLTADGGGAGVSGNVTIPLLGITEDMTTTVNLHNVTDAEAELMTGTKDLELRGSEQTFNPVTGELEEIAVRHVMRTLPKKLTGGSYKRGEANGASFEGSVIYYKKEVDGKVIKEIDKFAHKHVVNGVDLLAKTRANVGM